MKKPDGPENRWVSAYTIFVRCPEQKARKSQIGSLHSQIRAAVWRTVASRTTSKDHADAREHLYESVGKSLLVGRVGEACEIARAYLFLMQEGYGTGQTVVLDGGAVLV